MSQQHREEISRRLRPIRPPRVVDDVLEKDQLETVLDLIRRHGPWDLILKHHFRSLEELVATTSGGQPLDPVADYPGERRLHLLRLVLGKLRDRTRADFEVGVVQHEKLLTR